MNDDPSAVLHDCAREPIQFSGAIQPHGYLISCVLPDWTIRHVSANVGELLDLPAQDLLGETLRDYITEDLLQAVADVVHLTEPGTTPLRAAVGNVGPAARLYDISVHVAEGLVHLEFETRPGSAQDRAPTAVAQTMIARAASSAGAEEFHQRAVEQMRQLTGHDRVLVYQFLPDGAGEVIAEARASDMEPLMGLRFPESDIPAQARALYVRNRLRVIPNTDYVPVPILPGEVSPGHAMDLSLHHLRSVSPVHLEYSRNLGVMGSMSVSIISGGRLWGLIACHHRTPKLVTATVRAAAELFGMFVSMRVSAHEQQQIAARDELAREVRETLWRKLSSTRDLDKALTGELDPLARSLSCDGVALWIDGAWHGAGRTPSAHASEALRAWLVRKAAETHGGVLMTDLARDWVAPGDEADGLAGVLAIRLGGGNDWLLFFRVEQVEDVRWAGEPVKRVAGPPQEQKIRPRERFDAWRETIRGRGMLWNDTDRRMAERLRQLLHEFRRRAVDNGDTSLDTFESSRRRMDLREHKGRLEQLSHLLDGLVHLDEADTARLGERIAILEIELRALAAAAPAPALDRAD